MVRHVNFSGCIEVIHLNLMSKHALNFVVRFLYSNRLFWLSNNFDFPISLFVILYLFDEIKEFLDFQF